LEDLMNRFKLAVMLAGVTALASPLNAQAQRQGPSGSVPASHMPPPGMCRIWIDNVPPGQQPAPTDCATAVRNRPANAKVIFGDDAQQSQKVRNRGQWQKRASLFGSDLGGRIVLPKLQGGDEPGRRAASAEPMPDMAAGALVARGQRTADVSRWLGGQDATPQLLDTNRNGVPRRVSWVDDSGRVVQVWVDRDGDGRADRVELYQNGRLAKVVEP
jgi:hypothetical protein